MQITRENKNIYRRISAQKSFYSSTELNKSFHSSCGDSRRSMSKNSSRRETPVVSSRNSTIANKTKAKTLRKTNITV